MAKNDGGLAFPALIDGSTRTDDPGMTLRDYFAGKALSGIANDGMFLDANTKEDCELVIINSAALSYRLADAMIAERAK